MKRNKQTGHQWAFTLTVLLHEINSHTQKNSDKQYIHSSYYDFSQVLKYRIVENFDGGNFDVFDAFQLDRQNLTRQIV